MLIRVIVESPAEFERWANAQKLAAPADTDSATARAMFLSLNCINCHTVNGTVAHGTFGPNLTHLMSRTTLGSGVLANTLENLRVWIKDPQAVKRGNLMPNLQLNSRELDEVVDYLSSLK